MSVCACLGARVFVRVPEGSSGDVNLCGCEASAELNDFNYQPQLNNHRLWCWCVIATHTHTHTYGRSIFLCCPLLCLLISIESTELLSEGNPHIKLTHVFLALVWVIHANSFLSGVRSCCVSLQFSKE